MNYISIKKNCFLKVRIIWVKDLVNSLTNRQELQYLMKLKKKCIGEKSYK
jgi:hypothetical protein